LGAPKGGRKRHQLPQTGKERKRTAFSKKRQKMAKELVLSLIPIICRVVPGREAGGAYKKQEEKRTLEKRTGK